MELSSPAFAPGQPIPVKYTCAGEDVSPPLSWRGVPPRTKSLALILSDPDSPGGRFVHWVVYNLPVKTNELSEDLNKTPLIAGGGQQGQNSRHGYGYTGPCPPPGRVHHYHFDLYAVSEPITLEDGTGAQLRQALKGHVIGRAQLIGTFSR
ncbi:MAG TPA: YbhB/YbcL family Raf kinase inhibitor-like protein [Candidatus Binataceae bacterium]|nr:YbhB/YbcL family Raf kinase inhibitor-like protein [Candidatus Binataceae bacterium]